MKLATLCLSQAIKLNNSILIGSFIDFWNVYRYRQFFNIFNCKYFVFILFTSLLERVKLFQQLAIRPKLIWALLDAIRVVSDAYKIHINIEGDSKNRVQKSGSHGKMNCEMRRYHIDTINISVCFEIASNEYWRKKYVFEFVAAFPEVQDLKVQVGLTRLVHFFARELLVGWSNNMNFRL